MFLISSTSWPSTASVTVSRRKKTPRYSVSVSPTRKTLNRKSASSISEATHKSIRTFCIGSSPTRTGLTAILKSRLKISWPYLNFRLTFLNHWSNIPNSDPIDQSFHWNITFIRSINFILLSTITKSKEYQKNLEYVAFKLYFHEGFLKSSSVTNRI